MEPAPRSVLLLDEYMTADAHLDPKPPVNYVFVDYENVHDVDLALIGSKTVYLTLLLGARQNKLDTALVEKLMAHAAAVQLIRLNASGKNALDFALVYYLGKAAQANPNACFHIVSRDAGFDPLVEHLRSRHINASRHDDYAALAFLSPSKTATVPVPDKPDDLLPRVIAHLRKNINNRPKRKKTLISHLFALCGKSSTGTGVDTLIENLSKAGHITIGEKEAVTYHFDPQ